MNQDHQELSEPTEPPFCPSQFHPSLFLSDPAIEDAHVHRGHGEKVAWTKRSRIEKDVDACVTFERAGVVWGVPSADEGRTMVLAPKGVISMAILGFFLEGAPLSELWKEEKL